MLRTPREPLHYWAALERVMTSDEQLRRWQRLTVGTLLGGYAGYYFCRSNFSLAAPYLLEEFGAAGLDKSRLGAIASIGTGFYFTGKLLSGVLADYLGGRRMFLLAMFASVIATIAFGLGSGFAVLTAAWAANRLVQSMGWGALVKIAARWLPFERYGTAVGILSLSFFVGDAAARLVLGELLDAGMSWRWMFHAAAAVLLGVAIATRQLLHDSPAELGLPEPPANPHNVFGSAGAGEGAPASLAAHVAPVLRSRSFWLVGALSFGLTIIRESFNTWTPTYLTEVAGLSKADAGVASLCFPLCGGVSVVLAGVVTDRLARRRGGYMIVSLLILAAALGALAAIGPAEATALGGRAVVPIALIALAALALAGPYSFLAGAIALDLGGKTGSATTAGLVDGVGYMGGLLAGWAVGSLADRRGWGAVFIALAVVAVLTAGAAAVYARWSERPPRDGT